MGGIFHLMKYFVLVVAAVVGVTSSPSASPLPFLTPTPSSTALIHSQQTSTTQPQTQVRIIKSVGTYQGFGQTITYTFQFPAQGGQVSGTFTGTSCDGMVDGVYDGGEGGIVKGNIKGNCKLLIIPIPLSATYEGKLYPSKGKVDINYEGGLLNTSWEKGSLSLDFTPAP